MRVTSAVLGRFWGLIAIAPIRKRGGSTTRNRASIDALAPVPPIRQQVAFVVIPRVETRPKQGGDRSPRSLWSRCPPRPAAISVETEETVETEACDNPRSGVHQTYKATRDGQGREIGDGLHGGPSAWTSYQANHAGVLQRHMPFAAVSKTAHAQGGQR